MKPGKQNVKKKKKKRKKKLHKNAIDVSDDTFHR